MEQEAKTCAGCRHFCQHYVRVKGNKYTPIVFGHCANPRIRDKKPDTPACQRFNKK